MPRDPWFAVPVALWPLTASVLPRPWPKEAALIDLAFWEDQARVGRVERIPGRPFLAARWGWGEKRVRRILDLEGPAQGQRRASAGATVDGQPGPARGQHQSTPNADISLQTVSKGQPSGPVRANVGASGRASTRASGLGEVGGEESAAIVASRDLPRARGTEHRAQITEEQEQHHAPEPAQAPTATPEPIARAGDAPSADEPVTIGRRPGPLGNEQQRHAALDAVADPPPPRAPINLTVHQGEPKPPPTYHVGGKVLPGTLRDLVGNAAAQVLAPHFRWDGLRSPTQKLFDAADLRFIRGITSIFLVDLALEFDRRWGLRPKALLSVDVPWVDFGGEVADELERLHTFQRGVQPSAEQARGLIPDDARRAAFNAALKALGDGSIRDGWGVVGERVRVRLAAK